MSGPEVAAGGGAGTDADRTDRDQMDRLAAGDLGALDRLYEQYGAMAFSIAYRITGDRAAAEDVVQDAFLGAWRNAARYVDARGTVRTWLLSIVHHRAIDAIRRRRPTTELPGPEATLPDSLTLPDAWADVQLNLDREAVRVAIELAYFGGLTQTEIAERTGVPLGTVKGRLRLGLQGLRAALTPLGDPGGGRG